MIDLLCDNIISPLGFTTAENIGAVSQGKSALRIKEHLFGLPETYCVAQIDEEAIEDAFARICPMSDDYTKFEKMAILSANEALTRTAVRPESERVLFLLSTTKGNIDCLDKDRDKAFLGYSARKIAQFFLNPVVPIVVSNACISGLAAQITAFRWIESGRYDAVVIIGADVVSKFVVSGFQSFKALSALPCRPFDAGRDGLNIGEAAATMIYGKASNRVDVPHLLSGAMANDANHISGPSREAVGLTAAIQKTMAAIDRKQPAFIGLHGTATRYNDDMESVALHRCALLNTPAYSVKSIFGHTLGAAGILETIVAFHALKQGVIPATLNFKNNGTTYPLNVSDTSKPVQGKAFLKVMSGFGGSNAAIVGCAPEYER